MTRERYYQAQDDGYDDEAPRKKTMTIPWTAMFWWSVVVLLGYLLYLRIDAKAAFNRHAEQCWLQNGGKMYRTSTSDAMTDFGDTKLVYLGREWGKLRFGFSPKQGATADFKQFTFEVGDLPSVLGYDGFDGFFFISRKSFGTIDLSKYDSRIQYTVYVQEGTDDSILHCLKWTPAPAKAEKQ